MAKKKAAARPKQTKPTRTDGGGEPDAPTKSPSFEERLADVEAIVQALESGELSLDESLKQYERGVSQLRECHEHLSRVEGRVALLSGFDDEGRPITQEMTDAAESLEAKQSARSRRRGVESTSDDDAAVDDAPGLF